MRVKKVVRNWLFIGIMAMTVPGYAADINQNGQVGGLALPTARSLSAGTGYLGMGAGTPYRNFYVGIQPIDALRITIRQQDDERTNYTYPGLDLQIQLTDEGEWIPATALGYTHAVGQRRFGGEYFVASKRWWDLDFNLGLGWGRYANNGVFRNPFAQSLSSYRDFERDIGYGSVGPKAWYRGRQMGLFGGVTYQTPVEGLKLLVEYDRDPYFQENVEALLSGIKRIKQPTPFHIGARYEIFDGMNATLAFYNFSRAQLNFSYAFNFQDNAKKQLSMTRLTDMVPGPCRKAMHGKPISDRWNSWHGANAWIFCMPSGAKTIPIFICITVLAICRLTPPIWAAQPIAWRSRQKKILHPSRLFPKMRV